MIENLQDYYDFLNMKYQIRKEIGLNYETGKIQRQV